MKCEEIEGIIIDYLDGKLDPRKASLLEKHLETCESCLDEMKETQEMLQGIKVAGVAEPDTSLRINFYHMLHNEMRKNEKMTTSINPGFRMHWYEKTSYRVAAGIALLVAGTFFGVLFNSGITGSVQQKEIEGLKSEVDILRKTAMFTMLKDESSSGRIQAVRYTDEISDPDQNVIDALVSTLNTDRNVNVRMAAAYALEKFAYRKDVSDSLVKSLSLQTEPILQVSLINILAEYRVKSALRPVQEIIASKSTIKEVRAVAQNSLRDLI